MNKYKCGSDIGSVLIGNEMWSFSVPNIGGDGETEVRVYNSRDEFLKDSWGKSGALKFISSVQGRFNIYSYDCAYHELHKGRLPSSDVVETLKGRYGVYQGEWKVAFVKWED